MRKILYGNPTIIKIILVIAVTLILSLAALSILAYAAEPDSSGDPIALKSYVDSKLAALEAKLSGQSPNNASVPAEQNDINELNAKIEQLTKDVELLAEENASLRRGIGFAGASGASNGAVSGSVDRFTATEVFANQRITLGEGAEVVLRTGKALAIRGELGALLDLIAGRELGAGENITPNHLIISSRNDLRGMRVTEDAWLLIKGAYEIR